MSGAGRGVTPGAGSEAGQGGSAASSGPGQDRPASAGPSAGPSADPSLDNGAGTPGPGQADSGANHDLAPDELLRFIGAGNSSDNLPHFIAQVYFQP